MKIAVARRGGFGGPPLRGEVDTADLPADVASEVETVLHGLQCDRPTSPPPHPDAFRYEITVADGGSHRSVVFYETELPESLRPAIEAALKRGSYG